MSSDELFASLESLDDGANVDGKLLKKFLDITRKDQEERLRVAQARITELEGKIQQAGGAYIVSAFLPISEEARKKILEARYLDYGSAIGNLENDPSEIKHLVVQDNESKVMKQTSTKCEIHDFYTWSKSTRLSRTYWCRMVRSVRSFGRCFIIMQ